MMNGFKSVMKDGAVDDLSDVSADDMGGSKPRVFISSDDMPEVKGWKVGGEYAIKVRQVSRTVDEGKDGEDGKVSGDFEVIGSDDGAGAAEEDAQSQPSDDSSGSDYSGQ